MRIVPTSLVVTTFCFSLLQAQWSDSAAINTPVAVASGDQNLPTAVSDGNGGVVISWVDHRLSVPSPSMFVQRLDENGVALWGAGGKSICDEPGVKTDPSAAGNGFGGGIVAWVDHRGSARDIYAQRVGPTGLAAWTSGGILVCSAGGDQLSPQTVTDGDGGAIIVWQDQRTDAGDIYAQHISANGPLLWGAQGIPVCIATGQQYDVVAAADGQGGVFIGWSDERTGDADIFVQHLDSTGAPVWSANGAPAVNRPEQQYRPAVIPDETGGVIVVWVDWRSGDTDLYTQRITSAGTASWALNGIRVGHDVQNLFALRADGSGGAIAGFVDSDGSSLNVYGSRWDSTGTFVWSPSVKLLSNGDPAQLGSQMQMISDGPGGGIVVWADSRTVPGWDLYAQKFNGAGVPQWDLSGKALATAAFFQGSHCLTSDQRGGAIVVFEDNRTLMDDDLYAQRIRSDGGLSVSTTVGLASGWNLVSIPRQVAVNAVDSLFPGNISAFALSGSGYQQVDSLVPGLGVWVRFPSPGLFEFDGAPVDSIELTVPAANRWIILGSPARSASVTALQSIPPGAVLPGSVYEFDGTRYVRAEQFSPGKAYWVFVTQPCSLLLRSPSR